MKAFGEHHWATLKLTLKMADAILHETSIVDVDEFAHRYEHSH